MIQSIVKLYILNINSNEIIVLFDAFDRNSKMSKAEINFLKHTANTLKMKKTHEAIR